MRKNGFLKHEKMLRHEITRKTCNMVNREIMIKHKIIVHLEH
jgi:hypothetical protein